MEPNANGGNITVLLTNVRASYCYIFLPYEKTYCIHAIMEPGHPGIALIKDAQRKAAAFAWKEQSIAVLTQLAAQDKLCLHDGNISKAGKEDYKNRFFVSANSKVKPKVFVTRDGANVEIGASDPSAPYSGSFVNVIVDVWPQVSTEWGKRINAQVTGVQFVRHGDRFGGGRVARADEFGLVPTDADGAVPGAPLAGGADPAVSSLI